MIIQPQEIVLLAHEIKLSLGKKLFAPHKFADQEQVPHRMENTAQFPADLVTFTEEILNGKLHFLCKGIYTTNHLFSCVAP